VCVGGGRHTRALVLDHGPHSHTHTHARTHQPHTPARQAPVFRLLLSFVYTDVLPEEHDGANLDVAMAQHLLVAADRYELIRLRRICERRLCETVDVETVATTLTLAEQNHADELKKVGAVQLSAVPCSGGAEEDG
jgi:hypothetical protein